ncbi:MAG: sensor histidine kinase [Gammaproteobacteria bacterium]|nr:sensor histidine kinase [Gammaproteobacteria bacterium]
MTWLAPRRRMILLAMLVLLHLALLEGLGSLMDRILMLIHIGLFFLWQPFVRTEQRLTLGHLAMILGMVALTVLLQGPTLILLWTMLLAGIIGGKIFVQGSRWNRIFHLAALGYLIVAMLVFLLPDLLPKAVVVSEPFERLARYGLPLIFVLMLAIPAERDVQERPEMIDFAYSVFVFLLLAVLVLGSVAAILLSGLDYVSSLLLVLLAMGGVLLFLGWSWNPRGGFSGIGVFVSRYLLSASLPFELWVESLAAYPAGEAEPRDFLDWACGQLLQEVAWLNGVTWSAGAGSNTLGHCAGSPVRFHQDDVDFVIYTDHPLTPSMIWQFNILLQLLNEFYLARVRERKLRELSYLQAVYETGSRLTHDVKNILQSLNTLCAAMVQEGTAPSPEFQGLIRRQLPVIAQRLRQTLDKLGHPPNDLGTLTQADRWWQELQDTFAGRDIEFSSNGDLAGRTLPVGLFYSASENLLQNALEKRQMEPGIAISAQLTADADGLALQVCDAGAAIPAALAARLGHEPVKSENGLGIGMYQVARLAASAGYRLDLTGNAPGRVCFRLALADQTQN